MIELRALCRLRIGLGSSATRIRPGDVFSVDDPASAEILVAQHRAEPAKKAKAKKAKKAKPAPTEE